MRVVCEFFRQRLHASSYADPAQPLTLEHSRIPLFQSISFYISGGRYYLASTSPRHAFSVMKNIVTGRDLLNLLPLAGSLDADIDAPVQTTVMMMLRVASEFMTVSDISITSQVSLNGTTLLVNGVQLPLDMILGAMLDMPLHELTSM